MASAPPLVSEEQLLCPICLGVFVRPVSTPCGHNFCMSCLSSYWDQSPVTVCPVCKESYSQRPQLRVNTFISGLTQSFSNLQLTEEPQTEEPQTGVLCDVCTAPQQKALKSCVECLTSFCSLHLESHMRVPGLRRHTLVPPDADLQSRVCPEHQQLLQSFCCEERVLMCPGCESEHHRHRTLPLENAHREMRSELDSTEAEIIVMIQERVQRVQSIREAAAQRQEESRKEITHSERVLQELLSKVQRSHKELVLKMEEKQKQADSKVEAFAQQIELDILNLEKAQTTLQELKQTEDPVQFLQNLPYVFQHLSIAQLSLTFDYWKWKDVHLKQEIQERTETLRSCTSRVQELLMKLDREISLFSNEMWCALRREQQYATDSKLDHETAHPKPQQPEEMIEFWLKPKNLFKQEVARGGKEKVMLVLKDDEKERGKERGRGEKEKVMLVFKD